MKFILDRKIFDARTKPIQDEFDLNLAPDIGLGIFFPNRLKELETYCAEHPEYHIISILPASIKINKPVPNARFYRLAEGDADPDLYCCDAMSHALLQASKIREFDGD
jgi:hypothetical protein